ncbi:DUF6933 domain-containing protein [Salsipaludibacter albus]|uniref:DUF6933 domain-containing protein n=1 Tax=Salsipaludibacter albus TaxID=2849650 RepID=UPI001EE3DCFB|nr:hypothetical protein [Salsipaludibacter albus]MBY5163576.1 hypothetical protein [Salsipaludibacter albus]
MIVIHATKKLRDRVRADPPTADEDSTGRLGNWYANALFVRPQLALFVNETTLVPLLTPLAPAAGLLDRFPAALGELLAAHRLPRAFIDRELAAADELRLAPTANRSVLGVMNEFAYLARHYLRDTQIPRELLDVSLELAQTPTSPLRDRHGFPDRELQAFAAEHAL